VISKFCFLGLQRRDIFKKEFFLHFISPFLVVYFPYFLWRVFYFRDVFPNPIYVKHSSAGLYSILELLRDCWWLLLSAAWFAYQDTRENRLFYLSYQAIILIFIAPFFFVIAQADVIMTFGHRLLLPAIPFLVFCGVPSVGRLFKQKNLLFCFFLFVFCLVFSLPGLISQRELLYKSALQYQSNLSKAHIKLGKWLKENADSKSSVALSDAGAIPYFSSLKAIDMFGLCDREIAKEGFSARNLLAKKPEFIIISSRKDKRSIGRFEQDRQILAHSDFFETYNLVNSWDFGEYWLQLFAINNLSR